MADARALREIGSARMREGRFAEAADALAEAVASAPDDEASWRLLGGARSSQGDADGAVAAFAQAAALRPDSAKNHYNLGLALQRVGRAAEAREGYELALSIDPHYEPARARLAEYAPPPLPQEPAPQIQVPRPAAQYDAPLPAVGRQTARFGVYDRAPVSGGSILTLGIVGLAGGLVCGLPLLVSPIAWHQGNQALRTIAGYDNLDPMVRNQVVTGRNLGIVGTILLALALLVVAAVVLVVVLSGRAR